MQPGKVSQSAADGIRASLKITGPEQFRGLFPPRAVEDLSKAVDFAGYGGTFTLVLLGKVKGTAHTKGLRIRSPQKDSVEITSQFGDNGSCVECKLIVPHHINSLVFYSKLKEAYTAMEETERPKKPTTNVVPLHPDVQLPAAGSSAAPAAIAPAATEEATPLKQGVQSHVGFIQRDDDVKLFMLYVSERAKDGRITVQACTTILIEEFGFGHRRLAAPTLGSLLNKKLLLRSEVKGVYELPLEYRGTFKAPPMETSASTATEFAKKLAELEAEAAAADIRATEVRNQLGGIRERCKQIEPQLKTLQDEFVSLTQSETSLVHELKKLEAGNTAKQRLDQIKALLG